MRQQQQPQVAKSKTVEKSNPKPELPKSRQDSLSLVEKSKREAEKAKKITKHQQKLQREAEARREQAEEERTAILVQTSLQKKRKAVSNSVTASLPTSNKMFDPSVSLTLVPGACPQTNEGKKQAKKSKTPNRAYHVDDEEEDDDDEESQVYCYI